MFGTLLRKNVQILNNKESFSLRGHTSAITVLEKFPSEVDQNLIISGSQDTNIKLWDIRTKESIAQFKGHQMQINCLTVSPDGKWIVSGS
jgi:katanin p80 WD40 repeat-containing subunit B1